MGTLRVDIELHSIVYSITHCFTVETCHSFNVWGFSLAFFWGYQEAFRTLKSADSEAVKQNGLSLQFAHPDVRADADATGLVDTLWPVFVDNPFYIYILLY